MSFEDMIKENGHGGKHLNGLKKVSRPIRSISFSGRKSLHDIRQNVTRSISSKTSDNVLHALDPFGE